MPAGLNDVLDAETAWMGSLAAVPAALVLYALLARSPAAPAFARWIWRHGRSLITLSVLSYIALALAQYGAHPRRWLASPIEVKIFALAEIGILAYVLLSSRVRQAFLDFPAA